MAAKSYEFEAWVREVKRVASAGGKREMEELFSTFCEEWNTCTLPEKYYNLMAWEVAQRAAAAAAGGGARGAQEFSAQRDEESRRAELESAGLQRSRELMRAAALARGVDPELKKREELQLAASYAFKKGDHREQARLQKKLEEMDKEALAAKWR